MPFFILGISEIHLIGHLSLSSDTLSASSKRHNNAITSFATLDKSVSCHIGHIPSLDTFDASICPICYPPPPKSDTFNVSTKFDASKFYQLPHLAYSITRHIWLGSQVSFVTFATFDTSINWHIMPTPYLWYLSIMLFATFLYHQTHSMRIANAALQFYYLPHLINLLVATFVTSYQ